MQSLQPTSADYENLWEAMPLAQERLKTIILLRMVAERDARIAELTTPKSLPETE